jgi:hypothetical protein
MTGEFGGKTRAGMGAAHMADSVETVVPRAHPALAVCPRFLVKENEDIATELKSPQICRSCRKAFQKNTSSRSPALFNEDF